MIAQTIVLQYYKSMKNNETLAVRLSTEEKTALDKLRMHLGLSSLGEAVRHLIRTCATSEPTLDELMANIENLALCDESTIFATKEQLQALHNEKVDITSLVRTIAAKIAQHIEQNGWPLPPNEFSLGEVVQDLQQGGRTKAAKLIKSRFLSFWSAGENPTALAADPLELEKILRYRCGINKTNEMFDIRFSEVRRAMTVQHRTVSFFQPKNAFDLYKRLLGDLTNPCVWDPSSGFGARLLGFYAAYPAGVYYGNEPAKLTYQDNIALVEDLGGSLYVEKLGSEFGHPYIDPESLDLVFTSPPYFDKERYFQEKTQAWFGRTEKEWIRNYLKPTIAFAYAYLKPGRLFALNVDKASPYKECAEEAGFVLEADEDWVVRRHPYAKRKNKALFQSERLLIWRKLES